MGRDYGCLHAAALAAQLPEGSRTRRAENPDARWDDGLYMLRSIEHTARVLAWQKTEDCEKRRNFPKPIPAPSELSATSERFGAENKEMVDSVLFASEGGALWS